VALEPQAVPVSRFIGPTFGFSDQRFLHIELRLINARIAQSTKLETRIGGSPQTPKEIRVF
jgi:hypothetical protein